MSTSAPSQGPAASLRGVGGEGVLLDSRGMTAARWRAALAVLALVAGAAAVLTNLALFPLYSLNRDDSVYVAMARLLETGAVTLPADSDAFRPWASAVVGDRVVLKYAPPWRWASVPPSCCCRERGWARRPGWSPPASWPGWRPSPGPSTRC